MFGLKNVNGEKDFGAVESFVIELLKPKQVWRAVSCDARYMPMAESRVTRGVPLQL